MTEDAPDLSIEYATGARMPPVERAEWFALMAESADGAMMGERARRYLALRATYARRVTVDDIKRCRQPLLDLQDWAYERAMLALMSSEEREAWLDYEDREPLAAIYVGRVLQSQVMRNLMTLMEYEEAGWLMTLPLPTPDSFRIVIPEIMGLMTGKVHLNGKIQHGLRITHLGDYDYARNIPVASKQDGDALARDIMRRFDAWGKAALQALPPGSPEPALATPLGSFVLRSRRVHGGGGSSREQ